MAFQGFMRRRARPPRGDFRMGFRHASTKAFTLVEMAIVLVIIGLILSGGLLAVTPVLQNSRVSETRASLELIEKALTVYIIQNACLPCPATGNLSSENANAGRAVDDAAYATGCADAACNAASGIVPWVNLGLSESDVTDAFGNRISYGVTVALTTANSMERTPPSTYPAGTLIVNTTQAVQITNAAAYVLISHGQDGEGAFSSTTGVARASPAGSADQTENTDADTTFVQDQLNSTSGANHFDDIVRWRTAPMAIQLCGNNACGNPA